MCVACDSLCGVVCGVLCVCGCCVMCLCVWSVIYHVVVDGVLFRVFCEVRVCFLFTMCLCVVC